MPKQIPQSELDSIVTVMEDRPDGVSINDLVGADANQAIRRAMQRRLEKLRGTLRIRATGSGRHTRYFLQAAPEQTSQLHQDEAHLEDEGGFFVPISDAGRKLQSLLTQPTDERPEVGYKREFLSGYRPNSTFYLTARERDFLFKKGIVDVGVGQPAGTHARHILDRLLIDLSWNSSRLEGNKYSILDTHELIEHGKVAEGKSAEETQMILNHKDAIEFLVEAANEIGFNRHTLLNVHGLLSHNLIDPQSSGRLRQKIIGITGSNYRPLQTPPVIEECFNELLAKAESIKDPFEQSFFLVIQLPYLQPFADVNKRVSRLVANIPFIKRNLSPISFIDVPVETYNEAMLSIYEYNKTELARDMFVWAYERSARRYAAIRQSIGEPDPFRLKYREQLREVISRVVREKLDKATASKTIPQYAKDAAPTDDVERFIEAAETELLGLHEGNFARYRIRPSEFFSWKSIWERA